MSFEMMSSVWKRISVHGAAALTLSTAALAQSTSVPFGWSGFYIGAQAGYALGNGSVNSAISNDGPLPAHTPALLDLINSRLTGANLSPTRGIFGIQAGYNAQLGSIVFGGMVDMSSMRLRASQGTQLIDPVLGSREVSNSFDADYLMTVRPRIGLALSNLMIFATGGLAITEVKYGHTYRGQVVSSSTSTESALISHIKTGWTVGGGLEYALSQNWTLSAEYLFADFGKLTTRSRVLNSSLGPVGTPGPLNTVFDHKLDLTANIVRAGINYKF